MGNFGEQDAGMSALLNMATTPDAGSRRGTRPDGGVTPNRTELSHLAKSRVRAVKGAQDLFRALPELDTITTIAVSSILSTKDLVTTTVLYDCIDKDLAIDLKQDLNTVVKDYFDTKDKFPKKLYRWLHDAMSVKGASPVMVVPEASINEMFDLKVGTESFKNALANRFEKQLGILKSISDTGEPKIGLEALLEPSVSLEKPQRFDLSFSDPMLRESLEMTYQLTDNPNVLAIGEVQRRVARENARKGLGAKRTGSYNGTLNGQNMKIEGQVDAEDLLKTTDVNANADKQQASKQYVEVPTTSGRSHSHPMVRSLPAESVLPIILGGDERNPIGYLVILDETGNPLSSKTAGATDGALFNNVSTDILAEDIINRSNIGMGQSSITPEIAGRLVARFGEIAEEKLLRMVSKGIGGGAIGLTARQDWYRIMFSRHLAKRHTQVLYVPAENMSYFATDFNDDGIGVSLTERSYILSTVRMSLMFATMNSSILNSARNMQYDIELDANDKNPQATIDRIKADIINSYNNSLPVWGDVEDTFRASTNAGLAFNVEGNEYYPSQKVSISDTTPDYKVPDVDLDESFLRRTCTLARVDPDLVLTPENIEFASQIFSKSLIVTQQVMKIQEELSKPLTTYVTSYTFGSGALLDDLAKVITDHMPRTENQSEPEYEQMVTDVLNTYIEGMEVTLPPPDTSAGESQMEQFEKRLEFFEKLGEIATSDDILEELRDAGIDYDVDKLRAMVVNFYSRQWLRRNDIEGDFLSMFNEENRADTVKMVSDDVRDIATTLNQMINRTAKKVNTAVGVADNEEGAGGSDMGGGEDTDGLDDNESGDFDDGGLGGTDDFDTDNDGDSSDDFTFDDDASGSDADDDDLDTAADSDDTSGEGEESTDGEDVGEEAEVEEDGKEEKE